MRDAKRIIAQNGRAPAASAGKDKLFIQSEIERGGAGAADAAGKPDVQMRGHGSVQQKMQQQKIAKPFRAGAEQRGAEKFQNLKINGDGIAQRAEMRAAVAAFIHRFDGLLFIGDAVAAKVQQHLRFIFEAVAPGAAEAVQIFRWDGAQPRLRIAQAQTAARAEDEACEAVAEAAFRRNIGQREIAHAENDFMLLLHATGAGADIGGFMLSVPVRRDDAGRLFKMCEAIGKRRLQRSALAFIFFVMQHRAAAQRGNLRKNRSVGIV